MYVKKLTTLALSSVLLLSFSGCFGKKDSIDGEYVCKKANFEESEFHFKINGNTWDIQRETNDHKMIWMSKIVAEKMERQKIRNIKLVLDKEGDVYKASKSETYNVEKSHLGSDFKEKSLFAKLKVEDGVLHLTTSNNKFSCPRIDD